MDIKSFEIQSQLSKPVRSESSINTRLFYQNLIIQDIFTFGSKYRSIDYFEIENYYVYEIMMQQLLDNVYVDILDQRKILMSSPIYDNDAESISYIYRKEFNFRYMPGKSIRILLYQPSSYWINYVLKRVKVFAYDTDGPSPKPTTAIASSSSSSSKPISSVIKDSLHKLLEKDIKFLKSVPKSSITSVETMNENEINPQKKVVVTPSSSLQRKEKNLGKLKKTLSGNISKNLLNLETETAHENRTT